MPSLSIPPRFIMLGDHVVNTAHLVRATAIFTDQNAAYPDTVELWLAGSPEPLRLDDLEAKETYEFLWEQNGLQATWEDSLQVQQP